MSKIRNWFSMPKAKQDTLLLEIGCPWGCRFLFRVKKEGKIIIRLENSNKLSNVHSIPSDASKFSSPSEFFAGTASEAIDMITEECIEEIENEAIDNIVYAWKLSKLPLLQYRSNGQWIDV